MWAPIPPSHSHLCHSEYSRGTIAHALVLHVCLSAVPQLLESCFLVSAVLVLMAGMVFSADGFTRGSTGYTLLTVLVSGVIIVATATFALLLAFEVYRSVKYAEAHALARRVEEEAVEEALLGRWRRRAGRAGPAGSPPSAGSSRWRASIVGALRRDSSHGRRLNGRSSRALLGTAPSAPSPVVPWPPAPSGAGATQPSGGATALGSDGEFT
jgi:hypothetical protein